MYRSNIFKPKFHMSIRNYDQSNTESKIILTYEWTKKKKTRD